MRVISGLPAFLLGCALLLGGCARFHAKPPDKFVYVTAKQAFLRDRVAAVSNRTGTVANGDKLTVLERSRRFVKVSTAQGQIGWLDERAVATQEVADAFDALTKRYANTPAVGAATVRDEVYMHVAPGRETERFFRLAEGDKLQMLMRATLPKVAVGSAPARPIANIEPQKTGAAGKSSQNKREGVATPPTAPVPPAMEDWWLTRDAQGHTGWIYSRMMDVDAPDALVRYAEGQRIVAAYVLTHVNDPESGQLRDGRPDPDVPIYVTVLGPYKAGLPYDFDQVRVFSWNLKKHRYETAMRQKNIAGYLPVELKQVTDPFSRAANATTPLPGFTYHVLAAEAPLPVPDPTTGLVTPGKLVDKTYRLDGNITRRILAPGTPPPAEAHPAPEPERDGKKKHRK